MIEVDRIVVGENEPAVQARPTPTLGEAFREGAAAIRELAGHMAKIDVSSDPLPELSLSVAPRPRVEHQRCRSVLVGTVEPGATLTLQAPARDLRALFDAIGRALESAAPEVVTFDGHPLSVLRSDGCAEPSVHAGTIDANARDLCVLRASVAQALAVGRSYACQWSKGRVLTVERVGGPLVMAQSASADPTATHYDGAQGGPDAWRWEVGE